MKDLNMFKIEDCILVKSEKDLLLDIANGNMQFPTGGEGGTNCILLHGQFGAGKTTIARLLPAAIEKNLSDSHLNDSAMYINCALGQNGVSVISSIRSKANYFSLNKSCYHYFVLDEVDLLTPAAQQSLKTVMNTPNTIFVMTTNYLSKIDQGIINRSVCISFDGISPQLLLPFAKNVLKNGSILDVTDAQLIPILERCDGSIRTARWSMEKVIASRKRKNRALVDGCQQEHIPVSNNASAG